MDPGPSGTLTLARAWYAFIGAVLLLLTAGHVWGAVEGSRFDPPIVAGGLAVGVLAILASAWVLSTRSIRSVVAWLGILALVGPFAVVFWITLTTASGDAIALAAVPFALALAAAGRMAIARARRTVRPVAEGRER